VRTDLYDGSIVTPFYTEVREEETTTGNRLEVRYYFPSFDPYMFYDPVFGFTTESGKGLSGGAVAGIVVGVVLVAAIFIISFVLYLARKNNYQQIQ